MNHLKYQHPTIICPGCSSKQTGIIKMASTSIQLSDRKWIKEGFLYIECMKTSCKYVIHAEELDEVLTPIVKAPGDIRTILNYKL